MTEAYDYDCIVIGAGPAGASAAIILAQEGHRVCILERETFPRYRLGESLLPFCYFSLERLGMLDAMKKSGFVKKHSVQFASQNGKISAPFYFDEHMKHDASQTWQVERAEFDQMLIDKAKSHGVAVIEQIEVKDLIHDDAGKVDGVTARTSDGETMTFRAPMTVDASGRNAIAASKKKWRVMDKKLKKMAVWTYFKGAKRDEGIDEGATTVCYVDHKNWFWYIPMQNDIISVGLVGGRDTLDKGDGTWGDVFEREAKTNKWLKDHLEGAERVKEFETTADFSYRSKHSAADGLVLTGDAFAFLDPVFSSGVFLALLGGVAAGDVVSQALKKGDYSAAQFGPYSENLIAAIEAMRALVYAFYDPNFNFRKVFEKYPHLREHVTDCLIGNVNRDYNEMQQAFREFAELPELLEHGRPLITAAV
jgi:flavin-dependent dehydrogenase